MSPRTDKQYEEIRESKKALIMDTALHLFASTGYHETSISSIAEKAGISKGLMYNYFESKEELIRQIIRKGFDTLLVHFDPNRDGFLTRDEIRGFIDQMFDLMKNNLTFWKLYFMVLLQPRVFRLMEKEIMTPIGSLLDLMKTYFVSKGEDDPEVEARILGAILDGLGFQYILDPEHFPVDQVKNKLYELYCK